MTFQKSLRFQVNKPHNWFYNDDEHNCYYMTEKESKITFALLLLVNESKAAPCLPEDHSHLVDHPILENPVIHIKIIDFSLSERE